MGAVGQKGGEGLLNTIAGLVSEASSPLICCGIFVAELLRKGW